MTVTQFESKCVLVCWPVWVAPWIVLLKSLEEKKKKRFVSWLVRNLLPSLCDCVFPCGCFYDDFLKMFSVPVHVVLEWMPGSWPHNTWSFWWSNGVMGSEVAGFYFIQCNCFLLFICCLLPNMCWLSPPVSGRANSTFPPFLPVCWQTVLIRLWVSFPNDYRHTLNGETVQEKKM